MVGKVNGRDVTTLRDTGSVVIACRESLIPRSEWVSGKTIIVTANGAHTKVSKALISIETPYLSGKFMAILLKNPPADLIVGNVNGAKPPSYSDLNIVAKVQTRAQKTAERHSSEGSEQALLNLKVNREEFKMLQIEDKSLKKWWTRAEKGDIRYKIINGYLYKEVKRCNKNRNMGDDFTKLAVPETLRKTVLQLGHDTPMSGHQSYTRTLTRIASEFTWPNMNKEVKVYCKTCDTCQRGRKNKGGKSPMGISKIIDQPFVKIDIVGPLNITKSRNRYILTIVDLCTRWPEAIPLKTVTTEEVQNALLTVFYRMGFPETILSDNGSQFTSDIFKNVSTLLGIKICHLSVYHAMSNGCVERFNGTLKEMLRKVTFDRSLDWDTYLQAILFYL